MQDAAATFPLCAPLFFVPNIGTTHRCATAPAPCLAISLPSPCLPASRKCQPGSREGATRDFGKRRPNKRHGTKTPLATEAAGAKMAAIRPAIGEQKGKRDRLPPRYDV